MRVNKIQKFICYKEPTGSTFMHGYGNFGLITNSHGNVPKELVYIQVAKIRYVFTVKIHMKAVLANMGQSIFKEKIIRRPNAVFVDGSTRVYFSNTPE